jgi:hypothetical protein
LIKQKKKIKQQIKDEIANKKLKEPKNKRQK